MHFDLVQATSVLERTPAVLRALLAGLDQAWTGCRIGPDDFSPFDVVGHLIHGEKTDWMPRLEHIFAHGDAVAFTAFDRFAMYTESRGKSLGELLDVFAALRHASLEALRGRRLEPADFARVGLHPDLGRVTLAQLLATWAVHDLNHIEQIVRTMAFQYRDAVGPWRPFLGILPQG